MAESLLKSKLKRRKLSAEGQQVKIPSSGTQNRSHSAVFCSRESAQPRRCVSPAVAEWWSREQLTSVETLWALTLQSALPHLEEQQWQLVPQLPSGSCSSALRRPPLLTPDEQRWCDLSEEVAPFPESVPALLRTSSGPNPSGSGSSPEPDLSAQTPPEAAAPPDAAAPSDSRPHQKDETTAPGRLPEGPQPFLPGRGREPTTASSTAAGSQGSAEDACPSEGVVVVKEGRPVGREVYRDVGGGGGLQSCPMCLLEFPAGFSQMECDGHLAQCLSEVNVDVTW